MGIIAPALIIVFFSFAFGQESNYKVGIIDKDDNYISKEIIKSICFFDLSLDFKQLKISKLHLNCYAR